MIIDLLFTPFFLSVCLSFFLSFCLPYFLLVPSLSLSFILSVALFIRELFLWFGLADHVDWGGDLPPAIKEKFEALKEKEKKFGPIAEHTEPNLPPLLEINEFNNIYYLSLSRFFLYLPVIMFEASFCFAKMRCSQYGSPKRTTTAVRGVHSVKWRLASLCFECEQWCSRRASNPWYLQTHERGWYSSAISVGDPFWHLHDSA